MSIRKLAALSAATAFAAISFASPASAQATRTWVSGVGDDVNPCSRTAPCKTFAGAISKTAAGGEINCLDPGGFGAVTITKSLTIDCHYTEGGALAGGNGITVNAASTDVVVLRGLDIFGVSPPSNGVRVIAAAGVLIEDCVIRRFNAANSFGIAFQPSGATSLYLNNVTISQNGNGATGGGINLQPTGAGSGRVTVRDSRIDQNANAGVSVNTTGTSGIVVVQIETSRVAGTVGDGIKLLQPVGAGSIYGIIVGSTIANNTASGISGDGAGVNVRAGDNSIFGNAFSGGAGVLTANGAKIQSYSDNRLDLNGSDGAFTLPAVAKK